MTKLTVNILRLQVIGIFCLVAVTSLRSQCVVPPGFVCLSQSAADKASEFVDRYKAVNDALQAAEKQIAAMQLSITDRDALILKLKDVIAIDVQKSVAEEKYRATLDAIVQIQADLIVQLEKKISNNKSFLQKLLVKLQVAYYILAGIAIVAK